MLKKLIIKEKIMAMTYGGIMYFPLNVNFFEDAPIELIEAKFGLVEEAAVMKLLCKMYKEKGYYLLWGEEQCTLFSHKRELRKVVWKASSTFWWRKKRWRSSARI